MTILAIFFGVLYVGYFVAHWRMWTDRNYWRATARYWSDAYEHVAHPTNEAAQPQARTQAAK